MLETVEQYKRRMMGYLGDQNPLKVQASTAGKIEQLVSKGPRARLVKRSVPGKLSVVEILAHLADTEILAGYRVRSILDAPCMPIAAYDQKNWAEASSYSKRAGIVKIGPIRMVVVATLGRLVKNCDAMFIGYRSAKIPIPPPTTMSAFSVGVQASQPNLIFYINASLLLCGAGKSEYAP